MACSLEDKLNTNRSIKYWHCAWNSQVKQVTVCCTITMVYYIYEPYNQDFFVCAPIARKKHVWEIIENAGAPLLYILQVTSMRLYCLYSNRGTHSHIGACIKKSDNAIDAEG